MEKPPLWGIVNTAYNLVMDHAPESLQKRDKASAAFLGITGSYVVTSAVLAAARGIVEKNVSAHEFSELELACAELMPVAVIGYAAMKPEDTTEIVTKHPTYTAGIGAALVGFVFAMLEDAYRHSVKAKK